MPDSSKLHQPRTTRTSSDGSNRSTPPAGATVLSGEDGAVREGRGNAEASWASLMDSYASGHQLSHDDASPLSPPVEGGAKGQVLINPPKSARPRMVARPSQLNISHVAADHPDSDTDSSYFPAGFPTQLTPFEEERRRVIRRFGLDAAGRKEAIDRCAAVARSHFRCSTVVVSLALDDRQVVAAELDDSSIDTGFVEPDAPLRELPLDAESLKRLVDEVVVVEDAQADETFEQSAFGSITFFASATIYLPTAFPDIPLTAAAKLLAPKPPPLLPVGAISIMDRNPRTQEPFSEQDRTVLMSLSDMIAREFRLGFEQQRRETEARQALFLGQLLRTALVNPGRSDKVVGPPPTPSVDGGILCGGDSAFQEAAHALHTLTGADTAVILDLRAFHAPFPPEHFVQIAATLGGRPTGLAPSVPSAPSAGATTTLSSDPPSDPGTPPIVTSAVDVSSEGNDVDGDADGDEDDDEGGSDAGSSAAGRGFRGEASRWGARFSGVAPGAGLITVLGSSGHNWEAAAAAPGCKPAVSHSLVAFYGDQMCEFDSGTVPSPLSDFLPPETEASLSVPVFDHDGRPSLLLVLCSFTKYFRFEITDSAFVENVGAVCIGNLMRRRILEADRAKLAFLSQISHELRTPLHGIGSQIELIREVAAPATLTKLKPLLDVADVCIASLREVLDDTLEFSKISHSADGSGPEQPRRMTDVNLEELIEEVAKSCWVRTQQSANVMHGGAIALGTTGAGEKVDVILEVDKRFDDWRAMVDIGGVKRVLLNILGNALKFTKQGSITIQIYDLPIAALRSEAATDVRMIGFAVKDTGMGMSPDFIREELFIPFKQANEFANGAGLGVSICDSIVRRMHGSLQYESVVGVGTIARIALPLRLVPVSTSPNQAVSRHSRPFPLASLGLPRRRIISDELRSMLDPNHIIDVANNAAELEAASLSQPGPTHLSPPPPRGLPGIVDIQHPLALPLPGLDPSPPLKGFDRNLKCLILSTFLAAKGVLFAEAENGVEAVERFKSFRPNLVYCDVQMPIMGGIEATRLIRLFEAENSLWPAYIVALTGLSSESRAHKDSLSTGQFDEWLVKGGPSLKILGQGLVRRQNELDVLDRRIRTAAELHRAAQAILRGILPSPLPENDALASLKLEVAPQDISCDLSDY